MVKIIAEIGQAHDGSLGLLHSYIDAVSKTGVDIIKFQTHIAEAESSIHEPFRVNFSYVDKTRFDYWKRVSFSFSQWKEIKQHCNDVGLEFMSSPFSIAAVDLLLEVGVNAFKIGSGETSNYLMLEKIAKSGKDIILSSGMSSYSEIDAALAFVESFNCNVSIMQCTTSYPTRPENIGLNVITEMLNKYKVPVGLSDHSGTIYPCLSAVALGAKLVEVHAVFDKRMFGPDSSSSLEIAELSQLVEGIRFIETMHLNPVDKENVAGSSVKNMFGKSLAVNKDMQEGDVITIDCLETKKPFGYGVSASEFESILSKKLKRSLRRWDFINLEDIYD